MAPLCELRAKLFHAPITTSRRLVHKYASVLKDTRDGSQQEELLPVGSKNCPGGSINVQKTIDRYPATRLLRGCKLQLATALYTII